MHAIRPFAPAALVALAALVVAVACAPQPNPTSGTPVPTPTAAPQITPSASPWPSGTIEPSPGYFAFDAESIVGYYLTLGYACTPPQPSTQAVDHLYRSCELVDPDGRTRVVGIVTDPAGDVADAFTSLTGRPGERFLDPVVALEPFAAFLGALLGERQGESLLTWLAASLGEAYVTTTLGELTVATYTESPEDHSRLYLEIANRVYLESPTPSPR